VVRVPTPVIIDYGGRYYTQSRCQKGYRTVSLHFTSPQRRLPPSQHNTRSHKIYAASHLTNHTEAGALTNSYATAIVSQPLTTPLAKLPSRRRHATPLIMRRRMRRRSYDTRLFMSG